MNYRTDVAYRKEMLKKLLHNISRREDEIIKALHNDFRKPAFESVLTETSIVQADIKNTLKNMMSWTKPKSILPALVNFPTRDFIYKEPYGKVLIIAPWNYPFQLALCPLIAAVAAGNQVTLKPSELTPHTSAVIASIIAETFNPMHVEIIEGDAETSRKLLSRRWDYIFFTGSVSVGKIVAKAAAENLTPLTLELGGKNPCIIDHTAALKLTAKRITWGKFMNAGQTCIAPDYILIQNKVKTKFIEHLKAEIQLAYGEDPQSSDDYAGIINNKNWKRLISLLEGNTIISGGDSHESRLYIAPTLIDEPALDSPLMQEEIFGPILPIVSYENEEELQTIITRYEKPLSLYVFSTDFTFAKRIIKEIPFGGGCINDTVIHFSNKRLPFGGVGNSGMGAYHGKFGFDTFSHRKSIVKKGNWPDLTIRYAPYKGKLGLLRKILKWM